MALPTLDIHWAITAQLPSLDFVLPGFLPGSFGLLVAPGATGKSTLALDIAVSLALGRPIAGGLFPTQPSCKVVFLAGEENDRLLAERLRNALDLSECASADLYNNLIILPMSGESCLLVKGEQPTALLRELTAIAAGARLVIIDPIRRLHDGDENCSQAMTSFLVQMEQLGKATGAAVLGLHHANRATSDGGSANASRGSSALVDGARWQLNLSRMDEKTATAHGIGEAERAYYVAVDFAKTNYLSPRPRSWLKRQANGQLRQTSLTATTSKTRTVAGARAI